MFRLVFLRYQTENLRDQLKTSVLCSLEPHRQKHRSKLRDSGTVGSHLSGMDTVEMPDEKESVQSHLASKDERGRLGQVDSKMFLQKLEVVFRGF